MKMKAERDVIVLDAREDFPKKIVLINRDQKLTEYLLEKSKSDKLRLVNRKHHRSASQSSQL